MSALAKGAFICALQTRGADGKSKNGGASKKKAMRRAKRPKNGSIDDPLGR